MIELTAQADAPLPAAELFDFVADMSNNPKWQQGMQACTWTSESPIGVGSTYEQHARFLGRDIRSTFEVVEFEPGRRIRIRTVDGPMPLDITREVAPMDDESSRVVATIRGGPTGVMAMFDPLTRRMVRRNVQADYERLTRLLSEG